MTSKYFRNITDRTDIKNSKNQETSDSYATVSYLEKKSNN